PSTPVLFFVTATGDVSKEAKPRIGTTGVVRKLTYLPTLQVALTQNPGTRHVVVVAGSSETEEIEVDTAEEEFRSYEPNIEFQYWTELEFADLGPRLAKLEPDTIVLFLNFLVDSSGQRFTPSRVLRSVSKMASRPIYGTFSSFIGNGVVGG